MSGTQQVSARSDEFTMPEFDAPPADPIALFHDWFRAAAERDVREPGAMALATADRTGRPSNRFVRVNEITTAGVVFTSHTRSQKARDLAATGRASGVLYWRETGQQVILTGSVDRLPDPDSDALWAARPVSTHPMSVVSQQSAPLADEAELRARAGRLAGKGPLPRPPGWVGYHLTPTMVEFWRAMPDRLHQRLRYENAGDGWTPTRLQP